MIFLHGWPQLGIVWRAQMQAFAARGWRCIAPDMRGYGGSSAPATPAAYALRELVQDMVELHDSLDGGPAIWIGHDLGSPVAGALCAHYPERCRGFVPVSVPYFPNGLALPNLLPFVDRNLYPAEHYPDGQWSYYRFYLDHFEQTVRDFDADVSASLSAIFRPGDPASLGKPSRSALVSRNGGWFGSVHRAPSSNPDATLWPPADFEALVSAFIVTGFRPANAWYLNDDANIAYARASPDDGCLKMPVLFVGGQFDGLFDIERSAIGDPMRNACADLSVTTLPSGHWLPLEKKSELVDAIGAWVDAKRLRSLSS
jgi:pimeloyl-ACP methyl ester carboxylesterase